jgi:hypothetical protein
MKRILILDDNKERRASFERAARELGAGFEVRIWDCPVQMAKECEKYFPYAALISLEHDLLNTDHTGLDMAKFLADKRPVCPVIVHTANSERCFSMINELRFADWVVDRVAPVGAEWIDRRWAPKAKQFIDGIYSQPQPHMPAWSAQIPVLWRETAPEHLRNAALAA